MTIQEFINKLIDECQGNTELELRFVNCIIDEIVYEGTIPAVLVRVAL